MSPSLMIQIAQFFISNEQLTSGAPAHGEGDAWHWAVQFTPAHGGTWIDATLTASRELTLNPAQIVWLGALDNLNDRQAHTWRQTILRAPTTNQGGLGGNDLPAGYLYDHATHTETIVYFPPDSLQWSPHRFYELTLREVIEYRPTPRYGLGLVPNTPNPNFTFPPGKHRFRFWYKQSPLESTPDPWVAQRLPVLPSRRCRRSTNR